MNANDGYFDSPLPDYTPYPLTDIRYVAGHPYVSSELPAPCCPCAGTGWLGCEWLYKRQPKCTCGAGDPADGSLSHELWCDAVPCPFCLPEAADVTGA